MEISKENGDSGDFTMMHCEPGTSSKIAKITMPKVGMAQRKYSRIEMAQLKEDKKEEDGIYEDKFNIRRTKKRQQPRTPPPFPTVDDDDPIGGNEIAAHWMRPIRRPGTFSHHQTSKFSHIGLGLLLLMAIVHFDGVNAQKQPNDLPNETKDGLIKKLLNSVPTPSFGPIDDLINNSSTFTKAEISDGLLPQLNKSEMEKESNLENKLMDNEEKNGEGGGHFQLVSLNWAHVQAPFSLSLWLLLASIAKILFNLDRRLPETVPDSALLIGLGLVLGAVLNLLGVDSSLFTLPSSTFFLYLLPPIIFDAGYFMPNRQLFENLDSVLLFAFCGTIWNTLAIGYSLLWLAQLCPFTVPFTSFQILLFASLISAVDPVAVIAVFEEIHINEFLFINVFGEALLNDGVSVVLYQMFRKFIQIGEPNLIPLDYIAGIGSFLVIAFGGVLIGILFAVMASLATKYTTQVRILAPVFIFVIPYMAYLTAELFGLSSILAIVACGIGMKQYVKGNLSHDACSSVKYFVKMLAQSSETVIFMFLGLSTMTHVHHWDWMFVGGTIAFCLLHRIIGVVVQCAILNRFRTKKFTFSDQFVLSYGGLRGAIAFGLVVSLDDDLPVKNLFVTTCIAVIFFTVFVQGITIRPLLYWLKVEKQDIDHKERMIEKIYTRYCDYMMAGLEDIAGQKGKNSVRDGFERFNAKILKPVLMRNEQRKTFDTSSIVRAYRKITLIEAQQIVRSSIRKSKKLHSQKRVGLGCGGRVGPIAAAHSPSSLSSTLGSSNCWTTTSTAMMIIEDGGGHNSNKNGTNTDDLEESRANSPIASSNNDDGKEGGGKIEEDEEGGGHFGPLNEDDGRLQIVGHEAQNSSTELEQYLAQPDNAEMLYTMFSRLLDRKMAELRMNRKGMDASAATLDEEDANVDGDDIQDNYFDAFGAVKRRRRRKDTAEGSSQQLASMWPKNQSIGGINGQRRVMDPQRRRCSTGDEQRRRMSLSPAIERQFGGNDESINKQEGLIAARRLFLAEMPSLPNPIFNGSPLGEEDKTQWSQREWRRNVP